MIYIILSLLALAIPVLGVAAFFMSLAGRSRTDRLTVELAAVREQLAAETSARRRIEERVSALEGGKEAEPPGVAPVVPPEEPAAITPPEIAAPPAVPPVPPSVPAVPLPPPPAEPAGPDLESLMAGRWAVWIGGLALALGGVFLVRYTIEQGLLGPAARIVLGGLLSAVLIAAGEWLRRSEPVPGESPSTRATYIPGIVTAAGSSTAFATVFAAYALYGFLGSSTAFLLLGGVSLATLLASLLHGPWLAALGILAAYTTPFFVATTTPNVPALLLYLAFVTATATALGRLRAWDRLVIAAHAAAVAWVFLVLPAESDPDELAYGLYALALSLIAFGPRIAFGDPPDSERDTSDRMGTILAIGHAAVMLAAVVAGRFGDSVLTMGLVFMVIQLAGAWRSAALGPLAAVSGVLAIAVPGAWDLPKTFDRTRDALAQPTADLLRIPPEAVDGFTSYATMLGAMFLAFGLRGAWRGRATAWLAGAGAIVPVAIVAVAYARIAVFAPSRSFAFIALGLAAVLAVAAEATRRRPPPAPDVAMALFATGCVAGVCLGLSVILEKGWLTVALALVSLGIAWIEQHRPIAALRALAVCVAALVVLRLLRYPLVVDDPGTTPLFNWLLWGYGVPALAFTLAARLFRRTRDDLATRIFEGLAIIYTGLTLSLQIRHFVTGGNMLAEGTLIEAGLQTSLVLGLSLALQRLHDRVASPVFLGASRLFGYLSLAMIVLWLGILANPMVTGERIASSFFFNDLLPGYLLPAVAAGLLARERHRHGESELAEVTAALSLALAFAWVTLSVRLAFQGGAGMHLGDGVASSELYAWSAAWLAFAVVLLVVGLATGLRWFRMASAVVMGPTILKVFVVDLAHLEGALRAFSFLGLGVVLVGVGLLYQRLLRSSSPTSVAEKS